MRPEYRGDGIWSERSHKEAAVQLIKDAARYLPGEYLKSLVKHPGITIGVSSGVIGMGLLLLDQKDVGLSLLVMGTLSPVAGLVANSVQVVVNMWNLYRRIDTDRYATAADVLRDIVNIRNFL